MAQLTKDFEQIITKLSDNDINFLITKADKKPLVPRKYSGSWNFLQRERNIIPEWMDLKFSKYTHGIGVICGKISKQLICIDIDEKYAKGELYDNLIERFTEEFGNEFVNSLYIEKTVNDGYHIFIFVDTKQEVPTTHLARRNTTDAELKINPQEKFKVLVEIRGEGSYAIIAPTEGYTRLSTCSIYNTRTVSEDEYAQICAICCELDRVQEVHHESERAVEVVNSLYKYKAREDESPFALFNEDQNAFISYIESKGFVKKRAEGSTIRFSRPGKITSESVVYGYYKGKIQSFSTSCALPHLKMLNHSAALHFLEGHTDWKQTAKCLSEMGFGTYNETYYKANSLLKGKEQHDYHTQVLAEDDDAEYQRLKESRLKSLELDEELSQISLKFESKNFKDINKNIWQILPSGISSLLQILGDETQRDIVLMFSLGILSGLLKVKEGVYQKRCILQTYIIGEAGTGKGIVSECVALGTPRNEMLKAEYEEKRKEWEIEKENAYSNKENFDTPPPIQKTFLLSPKVTTAALIGQLMGDNNVCIIDTEGDTMAESFASKHGNYLSELRKAYYGEYTSNLTVTNGFSELRNPYISLALTSTPDQISSILRGGVQDGTISRLAFYKFAKRPKFKIPTEKDSEKAKQFKEAMEDYSKRINKHASNVDIFAAFSNIQRQRIQELGESLEKKVEVGLGASGFQILGRSVEQMVRIAALLETLAYLESPQANLGELETVVYVRDETIEAAIAMFEVIFASNYRVYLEVSSNKKISMKPSVITTAKSMFYDKITEFTLTDEFLDKESKKLNVSSRSLRRWINDWVESGVLSKEGKNYKKV